VKAKDHFNNTYIDTCKIEVDIAKTADDPDLPRAWSQYAKNSSAYMNKNGIKPDSKQKQNDRSASTEINTEAQDKLKEDKKKKFLEFLQLMKTSKQTWNDDARRFDGTEEKKPENKKKNKKNKKNDDNEKMNIEEEETQTHNETNNETENKDNNEKKKKKKTEDNSKEEPKTEEKHTNYDINGNVIIETKNELPVDERRLFVLNIPYNITVDEFNAIFSKYGTITETKLPKDPDGKLKGYAYVSYQNEESAMMAFSELDNKIVLGRILHLKPAYAPKKLLYQEENEKKRIEEEKKEEEAFAHRTDEEKSAYKKKKKMEMLKRLNDDTNWNTLFLNPNTILNEMAQRYNLKKRDILGDEVENQAVKVALAETQIIQETKDWLDENGMNLDAFNLDRKTCERSKNVILVKNTPYNITDDQLNELFSRYGQVYKCLLAPNKSIGIIEFMDAEHASNAFKNLSYFDFKRAHAPLYLEWAPSGLVNEDEIAEESKKNNGNTGEAEGIGSKVVFIKNLNFETTEDALKKFFENQNLGKYTIKIVKQKGLSCGYGFIEFELPQSAKDAIKRLQNQILDGHSLKLSQAKKEEPKQGKRKRKDDDVEASNKLIIRNLAFEATKNELKELVKSFGEVKSIRIPKKMDNQHRGFAFIEFTSVEEAKNAYASLNGTHLYGRKLNIEWAKSDKSMDDITKKNENIKGRDCVKFSFSF